MTCGIVFSTYIKFGHQDAGQWYSKLQQLPAYHEEDGQIALCIYTVVKVQKPETH